MTVEQISPQLHVAEIIVGGRALQLLHTDPADHIFRMVHSSGDFYESALLNNLARYLSAGDTVVDVGANIGNHALFLAAVMGCNVIAVEPNPVSVNLLRAMIDRNALAEKIRVIVAGVGINSGKAKIHYDPLAHNLGSATLTMDPCGDIPVQTLDEMLGSLTPRFVKIDTEGMELSVLRGAEGLLRRARPVLSVELSRLTDFEAAWSFLEPMGYVPAATFNFTPTHVFISAEADATVRAIGAQNCRNYIHTFENAGALRHKLNALEASLKELVSSAERPLQHSINLDSTFGGFAKNVRQRRTWLRWIQWVRWRGKAPR
jgi:FkbM family methyltransferase